MGKVQLKYRTFDDVLDEVSMDFTTYAIEGMIDPANLIKVVQKVNYELGLRIHSSKDAMVRVCNSNGKLPDDFYKLNYAFLCGKYKITQPVIQGRQTEDVLLGSCTKCGEIDPDCVCEKTFTTECGDHYQVVHKVAYETRYYEEFNRMNLSSKKYQDGEIKNGFLYTNVDTATVYINYEGALEDEHGNLLVLDNPLVNEFYEYALKVRLLENLYIAGEDVERKLMYMKEELRKARNNAISMVNTPDFKELKDLWELNRKIQYHRYFDMFRSR